MKLGFAQLILGLSLVALSFLLFLVHFEIYHDIRFIADWFLGSIAFLPISVLFVTVILDRAIVVREKEALIGKLNMVVGAFFSEAGSEVIRMVVKQANISDEVKSSDMQRAYVILVVQWIKYMEHLKKQYPYLYSLASRTNPFDSTAKAEIE